MIRLHHRWSSMAAQQVRLALTCKGIDFDSIALAQNDDDIWFGLGVARADVALQIPGQPIHCDAIAILRNLDNWVDGTPIFNGLVDDAAWQALLAWHDNVQHLRERLYAPVLPAFIDIGSNENDMAAYKSDVLHRYGMSVEALSNDRYDGFNQLAAQSHLTELGRHLSKNRFYLNNTLSACDILIACDLFPLQLLDGVTMPLDLMYYIQRVETACGTSLRTGLITQH
ncbi:hypothetical protein CAP31_12910 [Sulfuriferula sp. AH1]|nr:hypothetical protein CAP31_12910 [Sulfuriferula sp. AH1]